MRSLVGISYEALDCYELAQKFYTEFMDRELDILYDIRPSYSETERMFSEQKNRFIKVTTPDFGDIIVINHRTLPCHIGIYLGDKTFLHTTKHTGSVIERISRWQKRIEGYYRWPK